MSWLEAVGLGDETFEGVAARLRDGARRHRDFPRGYRYGDPPRARETREGASAALEALMHGLAGDEGQRASRLLERVAASGQPELLRALVLEVGARVLVREGGTTGPAGAAFSPPDTTPGATSSPPPAPAAGKE